MKHWIKDSEKHAGGQAGSNDGRHEQYASPPPHRPQEHRSLILSAHTSFAVLYCTFTKNAITGADKGTGRKLFVAEIARRARGSFDIQPALVVV